MDKASKKDLTENDLSNVFFRTQGENEQWFNQNAKDATDKQFDEWAKSRIGITVSMWEKPTLSKFVFS